MSVNEFWEEFLVHAGLPADTTYFEAGYFGDTEELATELLELVLSGKKTATCSSLYACGDYVPRWGITPLPLIGRANPVRSRRSPPSPKYPLTR